MFRRPGLMSARRSDALAVAHQHRALLVHLLSVYTLAGPCRPMMKAYVSLRFSLRPEQRPWPIACTVPSATSQTACETEQSQGSDPTCLHASHMQIGRRYGPIAWLARGKATTTWEPRDGLDDAAAATLSALSEESASDGPRTARAVTQHSSLSTTPHTTHEITQFAMSNSFDVVAHYAALLESDSVS